MLCFRDQPQAGFDRGRVETSNLHDHAVSARSEASGIAAAALCATAGADGFDRGGFESGAADVLGSSFCAFLSRGERGHYALIACISGLMPTIRMTRLRL
jgi:hypothetical protein